MQGYPVEIGRGYGHRANDSDYDADTGLPTNRRATFRHIKVL
jgi:hypothetical protein